MTRANFVKKARKDVSGSDIKKGESYYWWKFRYGGKHVSRTAPKPSQLINSPFLSGMTAIEERTCELTTDMSIEDIQGEVDEIKSEIENLRDQCQDSLDNMPEGLQQGSTGEMLQSRIESCDEMINEYEQIDFDLDEEKDKSEQIQNIFDEIQAISYSGE